jgi:acetyl-CoA carboxylase carboxyltransferase component
MKDDKASKRLNQLSSHLSTTQLPPDYSDVLSTITTLKEIAATPNPSHRGYARQKQAGKLWVRERISQLLDPNSFEEIGSVSGTVTWKPTGPTTEVPESFTPSNNVQGFGKLRGRRVLLTADDFSIRSGHADGSTADKTIYAEKLAESGDCVLWLKERVPSQFAGRFSRIWVPDKHSLGEVQKCFLLLSPKE